MSQVQIVSARLALLAAVLAAWALLPKYGVVDPRLLPPLGDVLSMLGKQLARPQVHEAIGITALEVVVVTLTEPISRAVAIQTATIIREAALPAAR